MKANILIDFLTFTVKSEMTPTEVITNVLEMNPSLFEDTKGFNLYRSAKEYNHIRVCYDGYHDNMGISVTMSGKGCRTYEDYHGATMLKLLNKIHHSNEMHGTRIDIACDDKDGFLDMDIIWEYSVEHKFRTRIENVEFYDKQKGRSKGARSVKFGSKSSLFRIVIYDKAKQTYSYKHEPELYYSHWIRFEAVFKDIYTDQVIQAIAESDNLGETVAGLITDKFVFIENDDINISRCSLCKWWADFLEGIKAVSLTTKAKIKHTIEEQMDYFKFAYGRYYVRLFNAVMDDTYLHELLEHGKSKLTETDYAQITDYQNKQVRDYWEPVFS